MAPSSGRRGRPWRRIKAQVLAEAAHICWICGHPGATYVDHKVPIRQWQAQGGHPEDKANLAPAHGALNRCEHCGRCCNESKGDRPYTPVAKGSRDW